LNIVILVAQFVLCVSVTALVSDIGAMLFSSNTRKVALSWVFHAAWSCTRH